MKNIYFQRKSSKTLRQIDNWEFMLLLSYVLSLGIPPFIGSNYIRKTRPFKAFFTRGENEKGLSVYK